MSKRYIQCLFLGNLYFKCFKTETNESIESYKYIGCKKKINMSFL